MEKKLSIICPIYNGAEKIRKNFESILAQNTNGIEVIYVDDGSTDDTPNIIRKYEAENTFIKAVVLDENRSAAVARKKGFEASSGKYIWFVDADDFIDKNACTFLLEWIDHNAADILHFQSEIIDCGAGRRRCQDKAEFDKPNIKYLEDTDILKNCFVDKKHGFNLWNKIFSRNVCRQAMDNVEDRKFEKANDLYLYFLLAYYAKSYQGIDSTALYYYCYGSGSTGHDRFDQNQFLVMCKEYEVLCALERFCKEDEKNMLLQKALFNVRCRILNDCIVAWKRRVVQEKKKEAFLYLLNYLGISNVIFAINYTYYNELDTIIAQINDKNLFEEKVKKNGAIGVFVPDNARISWNYVEQYIKMLGSDKIVVFSDDENCCQYFAKHYTTCPISKSDKGNESFFHRTLELVRYLSLYNIQQIFYANYMASAIFYDALLIKASGIKLNIINFEYMFSNMTQLRKGGAFLLQAIKLADHLLTFYPGEMDFWKQQDTNCSLISFPEKTEKNVSTTEHHIVWMGECKNIPYNFYDVVEIMERLSKKISNVKIDMIYIEADPEKIHNFETRANDFGISDKIALHYDLDEIDHIYQKAEICLMTSEYEIFPATLLKAYEYHLPIISYEQPCIYEFDDKLPIISIPKRDFFMAAEILSEYLENNSWESNITHKKRFSLTEVIFLHYKYGVMKYKRQVSKNKKLEAELENIKTEYIKLKNLYNKVVEKQNIPAIQEESKKKTPFFRRK